MIFSSRRTGRPTMITPNSTISTPIHSVKLKRSPKRNQARKIVKIGVRYCITFNSARSILSMASYQAKKATAVGRKAK